MIFLHELFYDRSLLCPVYLENIALHAYILY